MQTRLLDGDNKVDIEAAGEILRSGGLVAIPTETVYGLAANALNTDAAADIFRAKGRPQDNPLIVHISKLEQIFSLCREVPRQALLLAEAFWPGPLTMVMKKSGMVPDVVSAGLDTVGIRMPGHPVARKIIDVAGVPLAAPSANSSGRPSPTTAAHVMEDMDGKIAAVVDGGACSVGVESTVVDMTGDTARVLRPGAVTEEMIAAVLGMADTDGAVLRPLKKGERPRAPGMKYRHYAPKAQVTLFEGAPEDTFVEMMKRAGRFAGALCFDEYLERLKDAGFWPVFSLGMSWDHQSHAKRLFDLLRRFDSTDAESILAQCPRTCGVNAAAINRLRKSAGFNIIDASRGKKVIGITGRSGSGKSLLAKKAARRGALVLDADAIYSQLLEESGEMVDNIRKGFPSAFKEGKLDRSALAEIVFSSTVDREKLNSITHPAVCERIRRRAAEAEESSVLLDVPLLFESTLDRICTMTVWIKAGRELSEQRIISRDGIGEDMARLRLSSQPEDEYYIKRCDLTLENQGTAADFEKQIEDFLDKYSI